MYPGCAPQRGDPQPPWGLQGNTASLTMGHAQSQGKWVLAEEAFLWCLHTGPRPDPYLVHWEGQFFHPPQVQTQAHHPPASGSEASCLPGVTLFTFHCLEDSTSLSRSTSELPSQVPPQPFTTPEEPPHCGMHSGSWCARRARHLPGDKRTWQQSPDGEDPREQSPGTPSASGVGGGRGAGQCYWPGARRGRTELKMDFVAVTAPAR